MAKFWQIFKKLEEDAEDRGEELPAVLGDAPSEGEQVFLSKFKLRRGMWVMTTQGVGILTHVYFDTIGVQHTDAAGVNKGGVEHFPPSAVRQAAYDQIPAPRRPNKAEAARLGYA